MINKYKPQFLKNSSFGMSFNPLIRNFGWMYCSLIFAAAAVNANHFSTAKQESTFSSEGMSGLVEKNFYKNKPRLWISSNIESVSISLEDFNEEGITNTLNNRFRSGNTYSVLVKLHYMSKEGNTLYCMLDKQKGIVYTNKEDLRLIVDDWFDDLNEMYSFYLDKYQAEEVILIQFLYVVNNSYPDLRLKNVNKLSFNKDIVNIKETKSLFNSQILPLTTNEIYYGKLLTFEVDSTQKFVSALWVEHKDFIQILKQKLEEKNEVFINFDCSTRFYLYTINNKKYIITVSDLSEDKTIKAVYSLHGKLIVGNIIDQKITKNKFIRTIQNITLTFEDEFVTKKVIDIKLPVLKLKPTINREMNSKIGSFDMETFRDDDGKSYVYALGFTNNSMDKKTSMYYLTQDGKTSQEIIIKCIDEMLTTMNRDHIYYTHNLGGFDVVFLLHALKEENKAKGMEYYKIKTLFRDSKILKCVVKVKTSSSTYSQITFIDSYNLLTDSLDNLSKSFGSKVKKALFPHGFVSRNTLNYVGIIPAREYYKKKNEIISVEEYNVLYKSIWDLKSEVLKYLEQDLLSLLEIMDTFNRYVYINFSIQLTECLTIARLALTKFLKRHLNNSLLPVINNKSVFTDIKKAYYGGVAEVYKGWGKNLRYYDVNSLYPFAAKNTMPGHKCKYIESIEPLNLNELFGFFYCKVKTNNQYLGLLPVHRKGLIMPNGEWYGWYFSEELKFAKEHGYKIDVYKGYQFNKVENAFDSYVDELFEIKANTSGSEKVIVKFLLNSLIGRFGLSIFKLMTEIVTKNKYFEMLTTNPIHSVKDISDDEVLISFSNEISKKIVTEHGLDYIEVLNHMSNKDLEKINSFEDVSISIAAAITAYARVYMSKIKLEILKRGGKIYYTDTDSIITDIDLPKDLVGSKLGQFKLEYRIEEGFFISAKTYCLVLEDEYTTEENKGIVIKAKGVFNNSLTVYSFKAMFFGKENVTAKKSNTKSNYQEGYVNIDSIDVTLKYDAYSKRKKIYSNSGLWIDTIPLEFYKDEQNLDFKYGTEIKFNQKNITSLALIIYLNLFSLILFKIPILNLNHYILYVTPYGTISPTLSSLSPNLTLICICSLSNLSLICVGNVSNLSLICVCSPPNLSLICVGNLPNLSLICTLNPPNLALICISLKLALIDLSLFSLTNQNKEIGEIMHSRRDEIKNTEESLESIQEILNIVKKEIMRIKKNAKVREKNRILKEQNPQLYEELKRKRNAKDRARYEKKKMKP